MLKRFCHIKVNLPKLNIDAIDDLTPGLTEYNKIDKLCKPIKDLEFVIKEIQDEKITVSNVKHLFEDVFNVYPSSNDRLGPDASIIHSPNFKSAVAKILQILVSSLTDAENIRFNHYVARSSPKDMSVKKVTIYHYPNSLRSIDVSQSHRGI